ncbi:MAG: alanine racemase [candidate division Zixibacteria bacterium]|jgi:alanine racemase|nr:alanine racemase [candidate division Zixibacteria bacterium]
MTSSPLQAIELSRTALAKNICSLKRLAGDRMMAVSVKANAYGHGLPEIVRLMVERPEVDYVAVHSLEEALACRKHGWPRGILVLGPIATNRLGSVIEHDLEPTVFDTSTLTALGRIGAKAGARIRTHLKLETGTNRQGITEREIGRFAAIYKKFRSLQRPVGASMHFANIEDTTSHTYAEQQLGEFKRLVGIMGKAGIKPQLLHTASSAALILFEKTRFDLVRPGISLYGYWPSKETYLSYRLLGGDNEIFEPVLSWRATVTQIKKLPADSFVGYGCTYRTTAPTTLAVLPVGYYDGYPRALSNRAYVLVNGKRAPVRGRICMNLMMVDVTDIKGVRVGSRATLLGRDGSERLSASHLADWGQTIHYEVLSRISGAIERLIVD